MSDIDELGGYIRDEEHLRAAYHALEPGYTVKPGLRNAVPYLDSGGHPTGLTNVEVTYTLHHPDQSLDFNTRTFQRLEEFWLANDYEIITRTVDQPYRVLRVRHTDEFTIALKQGKTANLWLTASSAPVRRTRVQPPPPALP